MALCHWNTGSKIAGQVALPHRNIQVDCTDEAEKLCDRLQVDVKRKINELSLGNRKKVSIICAMQHRPKLFVFDVK